MKLLLDTEFPTTDVIDPETLLIGIFVDNIFSINFTCEADIYIETIPYDTITAKIDVSNTINNYSPTTNGYAVLVDDINRVWGVFITTSVEHLGERVFEIKGKTLISELDDSSMDVKMYGAVNTSGTATATAFSEVLLGIPYNIDQSIITSFPYIKGSASRQTRRERLLWLLNAVSAIAVYEFSGYLQIKPLGQVPTIIPLEKTYWKPKIKKNRVPAKIEVVAHEYELTDPGYMPYIIVDDDSGGTVTTDVYMHKMTRYTSTYSGNEQTDGIIKIEDVTTITESNVGSVLSRLEGIYYSPMVIEADVINNREYHAGQYVTVYVSPEEMYSGYITSCKFTFGLQAKAHLVINGCGDVVTGDLTIYHKNGNDVLKTTNLAAPVGTVINYTANNISEYSGNDLFIYRPYVVSHTISISSTEVEYSINYMLALKYNSESHTLQIFAADSVEQEGDVLDVR